MGSQQQVRNVEQRFLRHCSLPHMELRSTGSSVQGYKAHSHAEFSIGLLRAGTTCLTCDGVDQVLEQGDLVIVEPGRVHACNPISGGARSYHMLYIDAQWCCEKLSILYERAITDFRCDQVVIRDPDIRTRFIILIEHLHNEQIKEAAQLLDYLALHLLLPYCSPIVRHSEQHKLSALIKRTLLSDLSHTPSLNELSAEFGCAKETLIRLFKQSYGITPKSFVSNARIEKAKVLLRSGISIADVALDVGFSDQSQFHRTFVSYTASTPRQYQQAESISDKIP